MWSTADEHHWECFQYNHDNINLTFHVVFILLLLKGLILQCAVPFRADWAHWYDSSTPTFIMVFTEHFEFPLLPSNWLLNILATWKAMDCIHGCYIKDGSDYGIPKNGDFYDWQILNQRNNKSGAGLSHPSPFLLISSLFQACFCPCGPSPHLCVNYVGSTNELSAILYLPSQLGSSLSAIDTGCPWRGNR